MSTMAERLEASLKSRPDALTLAYLDDRFGQCVDGYRGLTHACNKLLAEIADDDARINELRELVKSQAHEIHAANVEIGRLQADVVILKEAMDRARDAYAALNRRLPNGQEAQEAETQTS